MAINERKDTMIDPESEENPIEGDIGVGEIVMVEKSLAEVKDTEKDGATGRNIIHVKFTEGKRAGETAEIPEDQITRLAA